jgi:hypothetical protein
LESVSQGSVHMLDCPGMVIRTAERLGLEVDPDLPWFVQPKEKEPVAAAAAEPEIHRIHVRGT